MLEIVQMFCLGLLRLETKEQRFQLADEQTTRQRVGLGLGQDQSQ